ncbi:MAG: hypothetical protein HY680_09680 [Chloroflexi bacterium]|nr:hypothetical protein [Chloroflexota bacterium]
MVSLQFLIDNMCANFTVKSMYRLVEAMLAQGPCTISELAHGIADRDRSLDLGSARTLAEGAVEALAVSGVIAVQDDHIYRAE